MKFYILPPWSSPILNVEVPAGFLESDKWNDWGKYRTLFHLTVRDADGLLKKIGDVKIGQSGMTPKQPEPELQKEFESLEEGFFSLGQDEEYYLSLQTLDENLGVQILAGLKDVAADEALFEMYANEDVMKESLLRFVNSWTVRDQLHHIAKGGVPLTRYSFEFTAPKQADVSTPQVKLRFDVRPSTKPQTNIHVLIGSNGSGKTYMLNKMTETLLGYGDPSASIEFTEFMGKKSRFANLVTVTFSAFDNFTIEPDMNTLGTEVNHTSIGLRHISNAEDGLSTLKTPKMLEDEFVSSLQKCQYGSRKTRWEKAISSLQTDPVFSDANLLSLASYAESDSAIKSAEVFNKLSSGHKAVLMTMTMLVELVEERTLVLFDEPESHLHPPLLSSLIRALSDLLTNRNGVAIIATHSPVVLQEVPKNCVWVLRRCGSITNAERPRMETFGENLGILTREAFGYEVTHSGFHTMLGSTVNGSKNYEDILEEYGDQLGSEARILVRALLAGCEGARND